MGSPEVEWAIDYERSLIPVGTRFPKKGDVYEPATDVEISYLVVSFFHGRWLWDT